VSEVAALAPRTTSASLIKSSSRVSAEKDVSETVVGFRLMEATIDDAPTSRKASDTLGVG